MIDVSQVREFPSANLCLIKQLLYQLSALLN